MKREEIYNRVISLNDIECLNCKNKEKCKRCCNSYPKLNYNGRCVYNKFYQFILPKLNEEFNILERYKLESALALSTQLKEEGLDVNNVELSEWIEKLGGRKHSVSDSINLSSVRKRTENSFQEKYGAINPLCKGTSAFKKRNETVKEKYGTDNVFQNKEIIEKIKTKKEKTVLEKYGVNNVFQLEEIKEKIKQTNREKYGTDYAIQNEKLREKYFSKRTSKGNFISSGENELAKILEDLGFNFQRQITGKFKWFDENNKFHFCIPDFLIEDKKIVIEYFGDFWHANPLFYKSEDLVYTRKASEIWYFDSIKKEFIEKQGYKLIIIWENDLKNNIDKVIETLKLL